MNGINPSRSLAEQIRNMQIFLHLPAFGSITHLNWEKLSIKALVNGVACRPGRNTGRIFFHFLLGVLILMQTEFGFADSPVTSAGEQPFDGMLAFLHLSALAKIGARPSDSPGSRLAQSYLRQELTRNGLKVEDQTFVAKTPFGPKAMTNIIARIPGDSNEVLVVAAHYDTKYFKNFSFIGANDGASGPAILLELGRCLNGKKLGATIWLIFLDGEEALKDWSESDSLYGSRYFVQSLQESDQLRHVKAMILLDMVGDADLSIEMDMNSTGWLREIVRENASRLGYGKFFLNHPTFIKDDHIPFLRAGIPSVDIIDGHYGPGSRSNEFWHTSEDTLDKVSPESLKVIGEILISSLPDIAAAAKIGSKK